MLAATVKFLGEPTTLTNRRPKYEVLGKLVSRADYNSGRRVAFESDLLS